MERIGLKKLRIVEGRTKLTTSHNGKDITFLHPVYGPNNYTNVGLQIAQNSLIRPTMAQTISLVHAAFNSGDKYRDEIKSIMESGWLWAFTGSLYIPNKGVYTEDVPRRRNNMPLMKEHELIRRLEKNDPSVRFVPFGFKVGEMSLRELADNGYVKALAGEESAEKLAEVASKFRGNPILFSLDNTKEPTTRVSALGSDRVLSGRLYVDGSHGNDMGGYAFGISKTG